jgi:hypothetical protein
MKLTTALPTRWLFPGLFLLFAACAAPGSNNLNTSILLHDTDCAACSRVFPEGGWQFVHEIIFRFPTGQGRFLGIVAFDKKELRCALTTLEGLTVFAARAKASVTQAQTDKAIQVERALPPLDKPGFAAGLIADLRLLFIAPDGTPLCGAGANAGVLRAGEKLCRWQNGGLVTDVVIGRDGCWSIQAFHGGRLVRTSRASDCADRDGSLIPASMSLRATGDADYELTMRLVSAEKIGK